MIHDFLVWAGWYIDSAFPQPAVTFWSTPMGLACSLICMLYHGARVLHPAYKADCMDTVFNIFFCIVFMAAFLIGLGPDEPQYLVKTWLMLAALRCLLRGLVDWKTGNKKAR